MIAPSIFDRIVSLLKITNDTNFTSSHGLRSLSQIMFALMVGRWSEKCVVYYIKSAN